VLIDAIIFSNEVDILELRLHELNPVVDRFLIVESLESHGSSSRKSSPVLHDNWKVVVPFLEKIRYAVLDRLEPEFNGPSTPWPRENFHRNALMPLILAACPSKWDTVMISDCDEIPRAATLRARAGELRTGLHALSQEFFFYDINNNVGKWNGTVVGTLKDIEAAGGPQAVRNRRDSMPVIENAGWHFSYFGGVPRILSKVSNFAHACEDSARQVAGRSSSEIEVDVLSGTDIYHRPGGDRKARWDSSDLRLPTHFLNNPGRFRHFTEDGLREQS